MFKRLFENSLFRFLIVGGLSTVINYVFFYIFYRYFYMNYLFSSAIGFFAGVIFGYWLNKTWTFRFAFPSTTLLIKKYFAVYSISLCLGLIAIYMMVTIGGVDPLVANFLSIMLTTCTNYIGIKFLVFRL